MPSPTTDHPARWPRGVMLFTLAYLVAAVAGAAARGNAEFLFYVGTMLVLIAVVALVHRRVGFTPAVLWGLSIWGLLHMAGGLVPVPASWPINGNIRVLYSWWIIPDRLKYDQLVHAYGFGVTTLLCWQGLQSILRGSSSVEPIRPTLGMLTLCVAAGVGFGALNEVVEFAATFLVEDTNVGDYTNTGWDLVANSVGAVTAAVLIRLRSTLIRRSARICRVFPARFR
jgi:uncharacterized membrane protein YjdF